MNETDYTYSRLLELKKYIRYVENSDKRLPDMAMGFLKEYLELLQELEDSVVFRPWESNEECEENV